MKTPTCLCFGGLVQDHLWLTGLLNHLLRLCHWDNPRPCMSPFHPHAFITSALRDDYPSSQECDRTCLVDQQRDCVLLSLLYIPEGLWEKPFYQEPQSSEWIHKLSKGLCDVYRGHTAASGTVGLQDVILPHRHHRLTPDSYWCGPKVQTQIELCV